MNIEHPLIALLDNAGILNSDQVNVVAFDHDLRFLVMQGMLTLYFPTHTLIFQILTHDNVLKGKYFVVLMVF